jgi:hypothetical protein
MVELSRPDLIAKLPGWGAAAAAALVGIGFVALPDAWLEAGVDASGIAALFAVAQPPLGATARAVLALAGGGVAAAFVWSALYLLFGEGGFLAPRASSEDGVPQVRRADAHPDAPPRRPLTAAELAPPIGRASVAEPAIPVPVAGPLERTVPADLDTPLAALDPAAIPPVPREPVRPVPPLAPGERLQTFTLAPPAPRPVAISEAPSIEALLRRLEQGARRRSAA